MIAEHYTQRASDGEQRRDPALVRGSLGQADLRGLAEFFNPTPFPSCPKEIPL
jgi:hypothetical protein